MERPFERFSICIKCGKEKETPSDICPHCYNAPSSEARELARHYYLSVDRFTEPEDKEKYYHELLRISKDIRSGNEPRFDLDELDRLAAELKANETNLPIRHYIGMILFILICFTIMFCVIYYLKNK